MSESQNPQREPEWEGPLWKHPYMIYIWLTAILFIIIGGIGYFAWVNDLIPSRGIPSSVTSGG